jgi:hypothetical protein
MSENKFNNIFQIDPKIHETWKNKIFLTFDIDWAHDEVILDLLELISKYQVNTTWFVTHYTNLLRILEADTRIELGLHPNFNYLLSGGGGLEESSISVIQKVKELVPTATSIRSHSLVQSERLIDQFLDNGFKRICNLFIPYKNDMCVSPFYLWNGAIIVPHQFQDNASLRMNEEFTQIDSFNTGFHVFDFHPIHVFLNTESLERYEQTRSLHNNPKELIKHRYEGYGTRNRLLDLLKLAKKI